MLFLQNNIHIFQKQVGDLRIGVSAAFTFQDVDDNFNRVGFLIGAGRCQGIKHIHDADDPAHQGDVVAGKPLGVAGAIPFFMMGQGGKVGNPQYFRL